MNKEEQALNFIQYHRTIELLNLLGRKCATVIEAEIGFINSLLYSTKDADDFDFDEDCLVQAIGELEATLEQIKKYKVVDFGDVEGYKQDQTEWFDERNFNNEAQE